MDTYPRPGWEKITKILFEETLGCSQVRRDPVRDGICIGGKRHDPVGVVRVEEGDSSEKRSHR